MADEPRRPPRRGRDDDRDDGRNDRDLYRLRDDDEPPPAPPPRPVRRRNDEDERRIAPRPRPSRRRDDEEDADFGGVRARRPRRSASVPSMDTRVRLIIGGVVLLVVLIGLAIFGIWFMVRSGQAGVFQPAMNSYLAAPAGAPAPGGSPAVTGKMVVVETSKRDVDWDVFFALPDDLRAKGPEEVGTIVQTTWAKTHSPPDYDNGATAYVQECDVTVIDAASHAVIQKQHFRGGEPPDKIEDSSEGVGSKPTDEVLSFLKGLPRR